MFEAYISHERIRKVYGELYGSADDPNALAPLYFKFDGKGSEFDANLLVKLDVEIGEGARVDLFTPTSDEVLAFVFLLDWGFDQKKKNCRLLILLCLMGTGRCNTKRNSRNRIVHGRISKSNRC